MCSCGLNVAYAGLTDLCVTSVKSVINKLNGKIRPETERISAKLASIGIIISHADPALKVLRLSKSILLLFKHPKSNVIVIHT